MCGNLYVIEHVFRVVEDAHRGCDFHVNGTSVWSWCGRDTRGPRYHSADHVSFFVTWLSSSSPFCFHSLLLGSSAPLWLVETDPPSGGGGGWMMLQLRQSVCPQGRRTARSYSLKCCLIYMMWLIVCKRLTLILGSNEIRATVGFF